MSDLEDLARVGIDRDGETEADPRDRPVLMPTTRPRESASAPPELPGLSAASVWMTFSTRRLERPSRVASDRPSALTTPAVTEPANPSGFPMATTSCPTRSRAASPIGAGFGWPPVVRTTARSESGSRPTTRKSSSAPSTNVAVPRSVPATTWADVTRWPAGSIATADPAPPADQPPICRVTRRLATDGISRSAAVDTALE
jgi:hypothetical protein